MQPGRSGLRDGGVAPTVVGREQVRPQAPGAFERLRPAPGGDGAVVAAAQDLGDVPAPKARRPRVLRVLEEAAREALLLEGGSVADDARNEAGDGLEDDEGGQLAAGAGMQEAERSALSGSAPASPAAGIVMLGVLIPFATTELLSVRQLAVGVALAVALAVLVVRPLLIPAILAMLGAHGWWPGARNYGDGGGSAPRRNAQRAPMESGDGQPTVPLVHRVLYKVISQPLGRGEGGVPLRVAQPHADDGDRGGYFRESVRHVGDRQPAV